jgi:uncharacterized repeat protein (TIGR01451 family)
MPGKPVRAKRIRALVAVGAVMAATAGRAIVLDPVSAIDTTIVGGFEIDGNRPDNSGAGDPVDWDTVGTGVPPVSVTEIPDASGQGKEDGFGGHSQNLNPGKWACENVATPEKDDISAAAVGFRTYNGAQYLYFNFDRIGNNGTADLDVELSRMAGTHPSASCNGELPPRTDGDLIVAFDQQGQTSTAADIHLYEWDGNATSGTLKDLVISDFKGHLSADLTFAEAAINLTTALGRTIECGEFNTVFMKSRASDAFNSDLKDRTDAVPFDLGQCPTLSVTKTADAASVSSGDGIGFTVTVTNNGPGTAKAVTLKDPLPGGTGITWSESPDSSECSIDGTAPNQTLNCAFGDLGAGISRSVHVTSPTGETTNTTFTNTATADATNTPEVTATASTRVDKPNLTVVKTAAKATVNSGEPISFSVTVSNTGPGTARDVTLNDPLPGGTGIDWTESPDHPDCSITGTTPELLTCSFGDLAPGQTRTVTVSSQTTSATSATLSNTATGDADNHPTVTSTATVTVNKPNLVTSKTADAATVNAGSQIGFTISVTNTGPGTATNVEVNDPLPGGSGIDWSESPDNPDCSITGAPNSEILTCTFGDLGPNQTRTVHLISPTSSSTSGTFRNTATITSNNTPPQTPTTTITVNAPNLTISKTADSPSVSSGSPIGFTVSVTNTGPGTATNVTLHDPLPAGTGINWSESPDNPDCSISLSPQTLTCSWGNLAAGQTRSVHVVSQTTADTSGEFRNTATVRADNHPDKSSTTMTNVLKPNLTISKTAGNATVSAGTSISFTIAVTNAGPGTATGVMVNDPLPSGPGIDWSENSEFCTITGTAPETLTCNFGDMAPGTRSVQVTSATTAATPTGTYSNTATVTSTNHPDRSSMATVTVNQPNLSVVKTADAGTVVAGSNVGYTITITNAGPGTATGVTLNDLLPGGGGIDWSESIDLAQCDITGPLSSEKLTCNFGNLPPGSVSVHVVSSTTAASCGTLTNVASVIATNVTSTLSSAPSTITIECQAVLTISKTACPSIAVPGGVLTYTITFGNAGSGAAQGVEVTDTLPAGTTLVDAGGGTPNGSTITWTVGTLGPNETQTRTVKVLVDAGNGATLTNTAMITATNADPATTVAVQTPVSNAGATTTGRAYGADANVLSLDLIKQLYKVQSQAPGTPSHQERQLASLNILGLVGLGVVTNTTESAIGNEAKSTAAAQVANVNLLGGLIQADVVRGQSTSTANAGFATGSSAGSTFANLRINGNSITNVVPNAKVDVKNPLFPRQTLARAVLLEESKTATFANGKFTSTHSVNMIHVTLLQSYLTLPAGAEIIVAHADTTASYPSGLPCGDRPGLVSGDAYNAWVNGTVLGNQFANVQVGDARISPLGGSDSDGISANIPGVVTNKTIFNTAEGSIGGHPTATARSRVEQVNVLSALRTGGLVTADVIDVKSTSTTTANSANTAFATTFLNLRVAGLPVSATPAPNSAIYVGLPAGGFAVVVLNEQTSSNGVKDTFGTVNAIHVYVYSPLGLVTAEVIVGHAHSDAHHP